MLLTTLCNLTSITLAMKSALLSERSARSASEARYVRESQLRAAAEERLSEEIKRRLEAEQNVQDLEVQVAALTGVTVEKGKDSVKRKVYGRGHPSQAAGVSHHSGQNSTRGADVLSNGCLVDSQGKGEQDGR